MTADRKDALERLAADQLSTVAPSDLDRRGCELAPRRLAGLVQALEPLPILDRVHRAEEALLGYATSCRWAISRANVSSTSS